MLSREKVIEALKQVFDPEIPINVWDLGLIYEIRINEDNSVFIKTTMTSPACPFASMLIADLKVKVKEITASPKVDVELTFDPLWSIEKMTEEGKAQFEIM